MKNLKIGQKLNISNETHDLNALAVGLSWDDSHHSEKIRDLDMAAFLLAKDMKVPLASFFVFYNNLQAPDKSVIHQGDNRTGQGEGDDETLWLNLQAIAPEIEQIVLVASIYSANHTIDSFGEISQIRLRIYNQNQSAEIATYTIGNEYKEQNAIQLGRFYRQFGVWFFEAMGEGSSQGLAHFVDLYA